MSNEELCDALIATFPTITLTGLTGDGAGITRGLAQAGASGVKVARVIADRLGAQR